MNANEPIKKNFRITKVQEMALNKIGLLTVNDILFYFPSRYSDMGNAKPIGDLQESDNVVITGTIKNLKKEVSYQSRIPMTKAVLEDTTGKISLVWMHQPYIAHMIKEGENITISGTVNEKSGKLVIMNPEILKQAGNGGGLFTGNDEAMKTRFAIYPESRGITSRWFYYTIQKILSAGIHKQLADPLPAEIIKEYHLPKLETALLWMHIPRSEADAEAARKRFAFEEIILVEIERLREREAYQSHGAYPVTSSFKNFVKSLSFNLTDSQKKVLLEVEDDIKKEIPMTRLLEGDVGSGKTAIAASATYATINTNAPNKKAERLQVIYMAPTEILANQHFETFCQLFNDANESNSTTIGLITSSGCKKFPAKSISMKRADIAWTPVSRAQLLKWAKDGSIDILIGTHSLMSKSVVMRHLALAIIDEQHRFGSKQRRALISKDGPAPHLLSMTATPIPRTLALTIFGNLDLSILEGMPPGRKKIITTFITKTSREKMYEDIKKELKLGRQAYVICPRINAKDEDGTGKIGGGIRSVNDEAKRLSKDIFKDYKIGVIHGKLKPNEKEDIMEQFLRHEIDILVATSVVEVGVNIPNATNIIIEEAERFGIAQLHQLRGRVVRGNHQPYCYLVSDTENEKSGKRITALIEAENGFALAEYDLMQRGPGQFAGFKQSGMSDLAMEALKNIRLVQAAKLEAKKILDSDPLLKSNPALASRLLSREKMIHFE